MRKLCLSLLICIILSLTLNFTVYSQAVEPDLTFDPSLINYSLRDTSEGQMIEFPYSNYNQWLANYKYLLIENISQHETIIQWKNSYEQLLEDTIWKESFDKCILTVKEVESDYKSEVKKNQFLTYSLITSGLIILTETLIIIYGG